MSRGQTTPLPKAQNPQPIDQRPTDWGPNSSSRPYPTDRSGFTSLSKNIAFSLSPYVIEYYRTIPNYHLGNGLQAYLHGMAWISNLLPSLTRTNGDAFIAIPDLLSAYPGTS